MDKEQVFSIEGQNDNVVMQKDGAGEYIFTETSGDYILPDYLPEIRKILKVTSKVIPAGKFISGGKAEFAGTVSHTVIYSDGEGRIVSSSQSSDYEFAVPLPYESAGVIVSADSTVDYVSYRLGGPRKISIRTTIKSRVHIFYDNVMSCSVSDMGDDVEMQKNLEYSMMTLCNSSAEINLSDTTTLDGYSSDILKIISCDGRVFVREAMAVQGGVVCRGDVLVKCIYAPDGGNAFSQVRKIPFEDRISIDGVQPAYNAVARGICSSIDVSMSAGDGNAQVMIDVVITLDVNCFTNTTLTLISDMYSTKCDYETVYENIEVCRFVGSSLSNFTMDGSTSDTKGETLLSIVDTDARMDIKEVVSENGKAVAVGNCNVCVLATVASESPSVQYASFEFSSPVRFESDVKAGPDCKFEWYGEAMSAKARIDTKGISFNSEGMIWIKATEEKNRKMLSSATPVAGSEYSKEGQITVCYPSGKTLWDVAKQYRVHPRDVAELNGISTESTEVPWTPYSLDGVSSLIIEK